jgi:hypothetical protein
VHSASLKPVGTSSSEFVPNVSSGEFYANALFETDAKRSRAFPAGTDVWRCAEDSKLVIAAVHGEKRLDDDSTIKAARLTPRKRHHLLSICSA